VALASLILLTGCSTKSGSEDTAVPSYEIRDTQIAETGAISAWDAVEALRPDWLRSTDRTGAFRPVVYVDFERVGNVEHLRSIQASQILRIRFMDSYEGQRRYGRDHSGGVFQITLIK
jgi:hypothetical protein